MTRGMIRHAWRLATFAASLGAVFPGVASAQPWMRSNAPHLGSIEVSGGAIWSAGYGMGSRPAEETRNIGTGATPFTLFTAATKIKPAVGAQARVGVYLAHSVSVEGSAQYLRPTLSTRVTGDAEQGADLSATDTLTRYVFDGSLVLHLTGLSFAGGRGVPFVAGGAGNVRDLHEGNELIQTGREYHGGAGLKLWLGEGAHRLGVRAELGTSSRTGGSDFNTKRRSVTTAAASLMYLF